MSRAVAYLRVSTQEQAGEDRFGLESQRDAIKDLATREGLEITTWYTDEGVSGAVLDRPGLAELFSGASDLDCTIVLVAKMDRIARDLMAQLWIEKELLKLGCEIISAAEPFRGQDSANVLFRQIIGAFAQFEKSRITERMVGGRKQKALKGGYAGGTPPLGYRASRGSKTLEIDPVKAEVVLRIFELARKKRRGRRLPLQTIADQLNQEGLSTAQGKPFQRVQVKRVLDNKRFYQGHYSYSGIEVTGEHPPLL